MNEEMNLTEDTNLEDNFDELFAEESTEQETNVPEIESAEETQKPETQDQPEEEPKYKVNFLGEEKEMPVSELVTAAQKGMNYDHVKSELDNLKNQSGHRDTAYQVMERMAQSSGMTVEQYIQACDNTLKEGKLKAQIDRGVPEDVAARLMELEEKENLRTEAEKERQAEAEKQLAYSELLKEYPNLTVLPDEVATAVANGDKPLNAYRVYELKQLKNEIAVLKKKDENINKTTGSLKSDAPEEVNDFLAGFNS